MPSSLAADAMKTATSWLWQALLITVTWFHSPINGQCSLDGVVVVIPGPCTYNITADLNFYTNDNYSEQWSPPILLQSETETLHLKATLIKTDRTDASSLLVERCWATPSSDHAELLSDLFVDVPGCPFGNYEQVVSVDNNGAGEYVNIEFPIFFLEKNSSSFFVHCSVGVSRQPPTCGTDQQYIAFTQTADILTVGPIVSLSRQSSEPVTAATGDAAIGDDLLIPVYIVVGLIALVIVIMLLCACCWVCCERKRRKADAAAEVTIVDNPVYLKDWKRNGSVLPRSNSLSLHESENQYSTSSPGNGYGTLENHHNPTISNTDTEILSLTPTPNRSGDIRVDVENHQTRATDTDTEILSLTPQPSHPTAIEVISVEQGAMDSERDDDDDEQPSTSGESTQDNDMPATSSSLSLPMVMNW